MLSALCHQCGSMPPAACAGQQRKSVVGGDLQGRDRLADLDDRHACGGQRVTQLTEVGFEVLAGGEDDLRFADRAEVAGARLEVVDVAAGLEQIGDLDRVPADLPDEVGEQRMGGGTLRSASCA
ncbi:MAG: hypothetical protein R3F11_21770 [Verrucomicrobiales bacterium]